MHPSKLGTSKNRRDAVELRRLVGLVAAGALCAACGNEDPSGYGVVNFAEFLVNATFTRQRENVTPLATAGTKEAGCTLWPSFTEVPEEKPELLEAGVLTVKAENKSFTIEPQVAQQDVSTSYGLTVPGVSPPFGAGTKVQFAFSGGTVPAFRGEVVQPEGITLIAPEFPKPVSPEDPGAPLTIDRSSDLPIAWTGGEPGAVAYVRIEDKNTRRLACAFPVSARSAVVPASLLGQLAANEEPADINIWFGSTTSQQTMAHTWSISIYATTDGSGARVQLR